MNIEKNASRKLGVFWSFLSVFLWATVYVATRWLMRGEQAKVDPVTLSLLRFSGGGLLLFLICLATTPKSLFALSGRDYLKVALLSQFSFVGMSVFLFWGQRYTTAINSSMIMSSAPVLTILLGLFIGEKISLRQGIGMALGTLGCMMVIGVIAEHGFAYSPASFRGDLLVLVSALSWSIAAVYAKKVVTPGNDLAVTTWSMLFASVSLLVINCFRLGEITLPQSGAVWSLMIYLAVFPTALGFYAWNAALGRVSLNLVTIMQYLTPIMTILMAWGLLGESLGLFEIAGAVLVISGIACSSFPKRKNRVLTDSGGQAHAGKI